MTVKQLRSLLENFADDSPAVVRTSLRDAPQEAEDLQDREILDIKSFSPDAPRGENSCPIVIHLGNVHYSEYAPWKAPAGVTVEKAIQTIADNWTSSGLSEEQRNTLLRALPPELAKVLEEHRSAQEEEIRIREDEAREDE